MEKINVKKAQMLYDVLDASKLFTVSAEKGSRSFMNVTFPLPQRRDGRQVRGRVRER